MIEPLVKCCAGLDVHRTSVVGTIIREDDAGEIHRETQEYSCYRKGLLELGRWLCVHGVELAMMERVFTGSPFTRSWKDCCRDSTWSIPGM